MEEKTTNKLTLKAGNGILKLMGKANQAKSRVKKELLQICKEPTYSLPKLPPNTNLPSSIMTYCQIILNDDISSNSLNASNEVQKKINNFKIRHSSLSFIHESSFNSELPTISNKESDLKQKRKVSSQINALQNKYSFLEIAQTSDINYFITKKFEPEIALFMSGANRIISVISQQSDNSNSKFRTRINLNHISNYIIKTNNSLEIEKQRTYDVKFVDNGGHSFELSEKVDFLDSSVSIITPNAPPFSYLFILNLVENEEIMNFAKITHQIRLMSKEDSYDENKQNAVFSSIAINYPIFRQVCQICKKNCTFSVILFLHSSISKHEEREAEKLVNLFCEKKKSYLVDSSPKRKSSSEENLIENIQPQKSDSGDIVQSNKNDSLTNIDDKNNNDDPDSYFADDSGGNEEDQDEFHSEELVPHEKIGDNDQDESSLIINRAESDIKEAQDYVIKNTGNIINENDIEVHEENEKADEVQNYSNDTTNERTEDDHSSLFELLKKLNNSEKENKEKLEKISEIQNQLQIMEENISIIKSRQIEVKKESQNIDLEISQIQKQTESQAAENEKMKKNVKEMIIRTGQLKSKYNDLLNEIHEKERKQREEQWKIISEKEKEMKIKVSQSESKWRKELENRKNGIYFINDKENQNENEFIDQNNQSNHPTKF